MVLSVIEQVPRNVYHGWIKGRILKLDEQLLAFRIQKPPVLANGAEVISVFLRLNLTPGIFQLGSFEGLSVKKRGVGYFLPVPVEEYVMVHALGSGAAAANRNEQDAPTNLQNDLHGNPLFKGMAVSERKRPAANVGPRPVFANGRIYFRNARGDLVCVDVFG